MKLFEQQNCQSIQSSQYTNLGAVKIVSGIVQFLHDTTLMVVLALPSALLTIK